MGLGEGEQLAGGQRYPTSIKRLTSSSPQHLGLRDKVSWAQVEAE